jgi:hypothetical protein
MAMGGFSGGDHILTLDALGDIVRDGEVRFFLVESAKDRQQGLARWVIQRCHSVPAQEWRTGDDHPGTALQLFDCGRLLGN